MPSTDQPSQAQAILQTPESVVRTRRFVQALVLQTAGQGAALGGSQIGATGRSAASLAERLGAHGRAGRLGAMPDWLVALLRRYSFGIGEGTTANTRDLPNLYLPRRPGASLFAASQPSWEPPASPGSPRTLPSPHAATSPGFPAPARTGPWIPMALPAPASDGRPRAQRSAPDHGDYVFPALKMLAHVPSVTRPHVSAVETRPAQPLLSVFRTATNFALARTSPIEHAVEQIVTRNAAPSEAHRGEWQERERAELPFALSHPAVPLVSWLGMAPSQPEPVDRESVPGFAGGLPLATPRLPEILSPIATSVRPEITLRAVPDIPALVARAFTRQPAPPTVAPDLRLGENPAQPSLRSPRQPSTGSQTDQDTDVPGGADLPPSPPRLQAFSAALHLAQRLGGVEPGVSTRSATPLPFGTSLVSAWPNRLLALPLALLAGSRFERAPGTTTHQIGTERRQFLALPAVSSIFGETPRAARRAGPAEPTQTPLLPETVPGWPSELAARTVRRLNPAAFAPSERTATAQGLEEEAPRRTLSAIGHAITSYKDLSTLAGRAASWLNFLPRLQSSPALPTLSVISGEVPRAARRAGPAEPTQTPLLPEAVPGWPSELAARTVRRLNPAAFAPSERTATAQGPERAASWLALLPRLRSSMALAATAEASERPRRGLDRPTPGPEAPTTPLMAFLSSPSPARAVLESSGRGPGVFPRLAALASLAEPAEDGQTAGVERPGPIHEGLSLARALAPMLGVLRRFEQARGDRAGAAATPERTLGGMVPNLPTIRAFQTASRPIHLAVQDQDTPDPVSRPVKVLRSLSAFADTRVISPFLSLFRPAPQRRGMEAEPTEPIGRMVQEGRTAPRPALGRWLETERSLPIGVPPIGRDGGRQFRRLPSQAVLPPLGRPGSTAQASSAFAQTRAGSLLLSLFRPSSERPTAQSTAEETNDGAQAPVNPWIQAEHSTPMRLPTRRNFVANGLPTMRLAGASGPSWAFPSFSGVPLAIGPLAFSSGSGISQFQPGAATRRFEPPSPTQTTPGLFPAAEERAEEEAAERVLETEFITPMRTFLLAVFRRFAVPEAEDVSQTAPGGPPPLDDPANVSMFLPPARLAWPAALTLTLRSFLAPDALQKAGLLFSESVSAPSGDGMAMGFAPKAPSLGSAWLPTRPGPATFLRSLRGTDSPHDVPANVGRHGSSASIMGRSGPGTRPAEIPLALSAPSLTSLTHRLTERETAFARPERADAGWPPLGTEGLSSTTSTETAGGTVRREEWLQDLTLPAVQPLHRDNKPGQGQGALQDGRAPVAGDYSRAKPAPRAATALAERVPPMALPSMTGAAATRDPLAIQRAETGTSAAADVPAANAHTTHSAEAQAGHDKPSDSDIDDMAREVWLRLRRRLAFEADRRGRW